MKHNDHDTIKFYTRFNLSDCIFQRKVEKTIYLKKCYTVWYHEEQLKDVLFTSILKKSLS